MTEPKVRDHKMFASAILALGIMCLHPRPVFAYEADCNGPFQATILTSVFGEPRASSSAPTIPIRFHSGVDITGNCATNAIVGAIEGGRVSKVGNFCQIGSENCVRVVSTTTGHAFDYEHVLWEDFLTSTMTSVIKGQAIGRIGGTDGNHLHLNEIVKNGNSTTRINPQFTGHLSFMDNDRPDFIAVTIGAVTNKIILIQSGTKASPDVFRFIGDKYYVRGDVDVFVTARNGVSRKGIYSIATDAEPLWASGAALPLPGAFAQAFGYLIDGRADVADVQTIYYRRHSASGGSDTYIPTNLFTGGIMPQAASARWVTALAFQGEQEICASAQDHPQPSAHQATPYCVNVVVDNTPPTQTLLANGIPFTGATSYTQVTVQGADVGSVYTITLSSPGWSQTSTNSAVSTTYSETFPIGGGDLLDGSYSVSVQDLAGNVSNSAGFIISTGDPFTETQDDKGAVIGDVIPSSRCIVVHATDTVAGIASITISGAGLSTTLPSQCGVSAKSTSVYSGAFCNLTENSTYTYTVTSCSGKQKTSPEITIATSTKGGSMCVTAPAGTFCGGIGALNAAQLNTNGTRLRVCIATISCGVCAVGEYENITTDPAGSTSCVTHCCRTVDWPSPLTNHSFTVTNSTTSSYSDTGYYELLVTSAGVESQISLISLNSPNFKMDPGQQTGGMIDFAQIGQGYPTSSSDGVVQVDSPFTRLHFSLRSILDFVLDLTRSLLRASSPYVYQYLGSDAIFNSTTTLTFNYVDAVNTDTATVRIYMFDGVAWSSAGIANQTIAYSTVTHIITAAGEVDRTGLYAALYQAQDSSAPITAFAIHGSSFGFDGALFVSTDAYVVLTATDPVVNGFASTVASMTYRVDPPSNSPFYIYSSSIPLSLGTHVFEYRSLDYAGNIEAIKTATFTVTAGTAFRTGNTAQVPGVLLNGFLGSGAKLEIESQAQNSLTLLISSANRQGMVAVDNMGEVGIGVTPQANLNIGQGAIGLQLRSGNSTSSVTSNQIAFGYNGDYAMRHLLRTEHSTSTDGNKMDFLVWNTGAGSTTAVAGLNVLSLQGIATASGGSFHVQPVGEPDAEVEVSNGLSTGGGTMQRLQVVSPSSRRFKTDIKDLNEKDEDQALSEIAALKHATFRYKTRRQDGSLLADAAQPLRTGLIYEEAPESIRDGAEALSTTERLVNVELALKAAMRRLEELQARYERLKARSKP